MLRVLRLTLCIAAALTLHSLTGCETYDSAATDETTTNGYHGETAPSETATEPYIERDIGIDKPEGDRITPR